MRLVACGVSLVALTLLGSVRPAPGFLERHASDGYGWPVKPFNRAHPVRSTFGDPRTTFRGAPTIATLYYGRGNFSFHTGIDIAAPDGTPVYAVRAGVVTSNVARKVGVRCADGTVFEYWHIVPAVEVGQRVTAYSDVLGTIRRGYGHVHLIERQHGRPTNPLARGHLTPYSDATKPVIERIRFRRVGTATELMPELLRGTIEIDAPVSDQPRPAAPGEWATLPTAPATISWRVERADNQTIKIRERLAFDVRALLPSNRQFWTVYARGTRQHAPTFRQHRYRHQNGLFLYRLGSINTRTLEDGIYRLVVTASDIRDNHATRRATFLVYNHRLWPPKTPQA